MTTAKTKKIYVAGHRGMVGSAILRALNQQGYKHILTRTSDELDLRNQQAVYSFFEEEQPDIVIIAAAKVGGILANDSYPYIFLHDNVIMQDNLIHASHINNVEKLIFLGSSCIYPKFAKQPMREDSLLSGELEPTNQWYAVAKITGVMSCFALQKQYNRDYLSLMPTNLYGPGDNFDLETSHVLPAMIRKFDDAKNAGHKPVTLWGSGAPMREFLYVDDVAEAVLFAMNKKMTHGLYNVGTGKDVTIANLARTVQEIVGHKGAIEWDPDKPDGTPRKLMDVSRMEAEGWTYKIELEDGIRKTYQWFLENRENVRETNFKVKY